MLTQTRARWCPAAQQQPRRAHAFVCNTTARGQGTGSSQRPSLRFFLDCANVTQWELWQPTGLFHGFTTNPTILERDGVKCNIRGLTNLATTAFDLGAKEIQIQSWGDTVSKLLSVAYDVAGIDPNKVVVKLPCTLEGIQTASVLRDSNVRVTITGVYTSHQVLLAQAVGAEYAAPYLGRMNDAYGSGQGMAQCLEMQRMIDSQQSDMRLLVASIRDTTDISQLAAQGCNTFTFGPALASKLFNVPLTIDAAAEFELAAIRSGALEP